MNFSRIISDLLVKDQKVTVPGLGILTYSYISAEVYKFTNRVAPPVHKLEFNPIPDESTTFIEVCAEEYDTSLDTAKEKISAWVKEIFTILDSGGQYSFESIGNLKKADGKLHFTPDDKSILFADAFGLEPAKIPLMEIDEPKQIKPTQETVVKTKKEASPMLKKILIAAAVLLLLLVGVYFLYQTGAWKKGYKAISNFFKSKHQNETPVILSDTAETSKRNALLYSEENKDTTAIEKDQHIIYYIIAGSFKSQANASKEVENLKKKGYEADVISFNDTLFRVTIGTYYNRRQAVEDYIALTNQDKDLNIWLYSQLKR